jgi:hypothetical protein
VADSASPDDPPTRTEFDLVKARAQTRLEKLTRANMRLAELSITETVANGAIRATVSSSGALRKVEMVGPGASRLSPTDAITQLTACIQRAQARIAGAAAEIMSAELGDDPVTDGVAAGYRTRFPAPPEPGPGWTAPVPPPVPPSPPAPPRPAVDLARHQAPQPALRPNPARPRRSVDDDDDLGNQPFLRPV